MRDRSPFLRRMRFPLRKAQVLRFVGQHFGIDFDRNVVTRSGKNVVSVRKGHRPLIQLLMLLLLLLRIRIVMAGRGTAHRESTGWASGGRGKSIGGTRNGRWVKAGHPQSGALWRRWSRIGWRDGRTRREPLLNNLLAG